MDGFWMEVERIQQRAEVKKEDCGEGRSQPLEGETTWACKLHVQALFQGKRMSGPTHALEHRGTLLCLDCCSNLSTEIPAFCFLCHCQKGLSYKAHRSVSHLVN